MTNINRNRLHDLLINMAIFDEVAEMGSFTATAISLQMTPSSVSKRIAKLEDELGVKLIERTTRVMRLTVIGEQLRQHCQNMMLEANSVIEIAEHSQESLNGEISIAVPKAFANIVLQPIILKFLTKYPEINIHVMVTDAPIDLLRQQVDCMIEITEIPSSYLIAKPLMPVHQVLCASPKYLCNNPIPKHPSELAQHNCLYLGETSIDNTWLFTPRGTNTEENVTVTVKGLYKVNHSSMRLGGIMQGLGIGPVPDFVAKEHLQTGAIIEILPRWELQSKYQGTAWLTYLPNKYQPRRLPLFVNFIQSHL